MSQRSIARVTALPWTTGVTYWLPLDADPESIFELVDDPAEGYCEAGMHADFNVWTLTVTLPDATPLEQARWMRRLAEQGLTLPPQAHDMD